MANCFRCARELKAETDFGRQDTCPGCGFDVRVCKNCTHYDPKSYNECHESNADRVVEKDKANFCDYFSPSDKKVTSTGPTPAELARAAAEALFKKK